MRYQAALRPDMISRIDSKARFGFITTPVAVKQFDFALKQRGFGCVVRAPQPQPSENYVLNRPARAGASHQRWITHIENERRLPRGVTEKFGEQAG